MLSVNLLQRLVDAGDWSRIVRTLAGNGLRAPLPLQARLAHAAPAAGLALRRLVELTYGPTSLSRALTAQLLHVQRPDGGFIGSDEPDPLATAAAVAGLTTLLDEPSHAADPQVAWARDRALAALAGMQDARGLFAGESDRTWQDRAASSAFVLALLGSVDAFRESVRFADLLTWFEENEARLEPTTLELLELARADQPAGVGASPAVAAIAA